MTMVFQRALLEAMQRYLKYMHPKTDMDDGVDCASWQAGVVSSLGELSNISTTGTRLD